MSSQQALVLWASVALMALMTLNAVQYLFLNFSAIVPTWTWLAKPIGNSDSWRVMHLALSYLEAHPDRSGLYPALFFEAHEKFQYAPTSLVLFWFAKAAGFDLSYWALNDFNRLLILVTAAANGWLMWLLTARARLTSPVPRLRFNVSLFAAGATLAFYPVMMGFWLGQLQVWINAVFVAACIAWLSGRLFLAGVAVGFICLLKPQFGLFLVWGLIRREWRFTAGMAATGGVGLGLSLILFGIQNHLDYLQVLGFLSRHGEIYYHNQSFNGLLQRVFGDPTASLTFDGHGFPTFSLPVYAGTLATSAALMAAALWKRADRGSLFDFLTAAVAITIASPIAWEHHYGVLAPALVAMLAAILATPARSRRPFAPWALLAAFLLTGNDLKAFEALVGTPLHVLLSGGLLGGLVALTVLARPARTLGTAVFQPAAKA